MAISGVEADYDGEQMTLDMARDLLEKQGIASIIYTSPSHRAEAPRWRVLCPFREEMPGQCRNHQLGRLNGLFRDVFSNESWTLSQSYYFGSVNRNRLHRVEVVPAFRSISTTTWIRSGLASRSIKESRPRSATWWPKRPRRW